MITCQHCRYFRASATNPTVTTLRAAAMGRCMHQARHGFFYPMESHSCSDHETAFDGKNGNGYQPRSDRRSGRPPGAE